jgi:heptose-I-phosphate ethanolaminephosphotransferase
VKQRLLIGLSVAGIALPFAFLLPRHVDSALGVVAVAAAIAFAAAMLARELPARMLAGFSVLFVLLVGLGLARAEHYSGHEALTDFALLYLAFYAGCAAAALHPALGRVVSAIPVLALVSVAILRAAHAYLFGSEVGAEGYRAILQSSFAEVVEFMGQFLDARLLAASVALLVVAVVAASPARLTKRALAWGAAGCLAAGAILLVNPEAVSERTRGLAEAMDYLSELRDYRTLRSARQALGAAPAVTQQAPLASEPQTYVFVIGESLTRNHMSLYGYWRETTPALDRLRAELAVFVDAVAPHSHTDPSLERVLTLSKTDNSLGFTDPGNHSLIELLRAAGFATWWLSNQNTLGAWDNKTSVLAASAEHVHFANQATGRYVTGEHDEVLMAPLAAALADPAPRKAIFLHFLGNHWEYHKRYPPEQAAFSAPHEARETGARAEIQVKRHAVVHYDNAVRYHDLLVARVLDQLRATGKPAAAVVFSDHGESLFEARGHHWKQFTRDHVEVPLLLWFSPEFRRRVPGALERARDAARRPFALENLPHLVADALLLESSVFEPARSPLSSRYQPKPRRLFDGQLVYEAADEPVLNTRRALERFEAMRPRAWAHRVNTLGKLMEAAPLFDGVEFDVVFDSGELLVSHPPAAPSGLTLGEQLAYADRLRPGLSFWIDLKNLSERNAAQVIAALKELDRRHALRRRALIETPHTGPAAAALRAAGFTTSYYFTKCEPGMGRMLAERRFAAVSYDIALRKGAGQCVGAAVQDLRLRTYTWDLGQFLSDRRFPEKPDLERYGGFAAVLLPFRSRFEDWR